MSANTSLKSSSLFSSTSLFFDLFDLVITSPLFIIFTYNSYYNKTKKQNQFNKKGAFLLAKYLSS